MAYQNFLIAPYTQGIGNDVEPWLLPENAFEKLENAYVTYKSTIRRKGGTDLKGRLQKQVTSVAKDSGSSTGPYAFTASNTPVAPGTVKIYDNVTLLGTDDGSGSFTGSGTAGEVTAGTVNYATGAIAGVTLAQAPGIDPTMNYDYYPMSPVMGICKQETDNVNIDKTIIFDRTTAYQWDATDLRFEDINTAGQTWSGTDYDFFWSCNYYTVSGNKLFWVTNGKATNGSGADGIKYYNGTTWTTLRAPLDSGASAYLEGCKFLVPFKSRLIALSTYEESGPVHYAQRARWCKIGNPTTIAPAADSVWRSDAIGYGGYVDASTDEHITGYALLGEDLIVYFERSTWKLAYTGIKEQPFVFRRISDEYGCESPQSIILLKGNALAIGHKGLTACNGQQVERIDEKIPNAIASIRNKTQGKQRVHGVRDNDNELIYWTIPEGEDNTYPEKLLVFNEKNGSFSYFDDGFTTLGTYQDVSGRTWSSFITDPEDTWKMQNMSWDSIGNKAEARLIVGGNQQGFISVLYSRASNSPYLHATSITTGTNELTITSASHNLKDGDYVKLDNLCGISGYSENTGTYQIQETATNTFVVPITGVSGTYTGGGRIAKVTPFNILTKKFNPLVKEGGQLKIGYADLFLEDTTDGQISLYVIIDNLRGAGTGYVKSITDLSTTREYGPSNADKYWHRVLINSRGQFLQLKLTLSDSQITNDTYLLAPFEMHAMNLWLTKAGKWVGLK